jgi:large subunit ribosomal protein L3
MVPGLIAKKVGMSRVFLESGEAVPVTYLKVDPNTVVRTKKQDRDGYNAIVLGLDESIKKTRKGTELKKYKAQKEWKVDSLEDFAPGKQISSEGLEEGAKVSITGTSKGKGFQGVIKRYNFSRGPETHGSHHHRKPGSVGMKEFPGHIIKGKKMPGHMGKDTVTLRSRSVVVSDPKKGVLAIKGPIPGPNGAYVYLTPEVDSSDKS